MTREITNRKPPLLVIGGVTASGKTSLAIALARRFNGEIVSADSMQIYRGMEIATAAPTAEELRQAPHHLVGVLAPGTEFSAAEYAALAKKAIREIHARNRLPILAGGTGLYLKAVMDNLEFEQFPGDRELRERLLRQAETNGKDWLHGELRRLDPVTAEKTHPNNVVRVARALEVTLSSGIPMSEQQRRAARAGSEYQICALALDYADREALWDAVGNRVDEMVSRGLLEEARRFYANHPARTAAAAIGYKELRGALEDREPLEPALERLKLRTRQYAKRQSTWFRGDPRYQMLFVDRVPAREALADQAAQLVYKKFTFTDPPGVL